VKFTSLGTTGSNFTQMGFNLYIWRNRRPARCGDPTKALGACALGLRRAEMAARVSEGRTRPARPDSG
jgi:hypothetical protein